MSFSILNYVIVGMKIMTPVLNRDLLKQIIPAAKDKDIEFYLDALNSKLSGVEIDTPLRIAHFIAQIAHESGSFKYKSENLNYSAKALRAVFGKYFKSDDVAESYARKPEHIANIVYANRMGNGNASSGDGWRYRGRGLIQLTGCENYTKCGESIGKDLATFPDFLIFDPFAAVSAACWYWQSRDLNRFADSDDIRSITRKINGGYHGLKDREEYLARAKKEFGIY